MKQEENKEMFETQFSFNQRVKIINGFYRGFYANVKDVTKENDQYIYTLELVQNNLNNKTKEIKAKEEFLRKVKTLFNM